ncbi:MAG: hypothetical protein V1875_02605 [Candidatus Altiarchaeota archaeon]
MLTVFVVAQLLFIILPINAMAGTAVPTGTLAMRNTVCRILDAIEFVITALGSSLVIIMFTYGGLKYVFGADDPGARKQGKNTCIHSVIGGIIIVIASLVVNMIGFTAAMSCP